MKLGMGFHPEKWTDAHLAMARQLGCETVIAWVPFGAGDGVWYAEDFARIAAQAKKHGLVLEGNENPHPQHIDHIVLDEPGKDEQMKNLPPTTPEQHWAWLKYFLEGLCPVAEKYGMKLCAHPDDPPIEYLKGTFRPQTSIEGMRKLVNLVDSPANCLEFCQGTVSTMRGIDVYAAIEEFASAGKIGYVHFRNTSGRLPRYSEVFIDNGYVDMPSRSGTFAV